jgi:hypothetical protein
MSEQELQDWLQELLSEFTYLADDDRSEIGFESADWLEDARISSFNEAGLLTNDKGIVLRTAEGDEFQITIIRSR